MCLRLRNRLRELVMMRKIRRVCEWCGSPFGTRHRHKRFCSRRCRRGALDYGRVDREPEVKPVRIRRGKYLGE